MKPPPIEPTSSEKMVSTMSFSLWAVVANHPEKKTPGPGNRSRDRMSPQSTDELSAPVALLQSRILSAVPRPCLDRPPNRKENPVSTLNEIKKVI